MSTQIKAKEFGIRRALAGDAPAIGAVFDAAVREEWSYLGPIAREPMFSAEEWRQLVADHAPPRALFVATDADGKVIGYEGLYHLKNSTGIYRNIWDYIADVEPDGGGQPFRATFTEIFEGFEGRQPEVGDRVCVTFNPKNNEVKLDREALRGELKATEDARAEGFDAIAAAAPGTMPPAPAAQSPATTEPTAAGLAGHTADFSGTMAAIAAARASGDLDEVKRLKAEFAARRAAEP